MNYSLHRDSDRERLPSGMRRVGYDADTQRYTFQDRDGKLWEGGEGEQYGKLHRKQTSSTPQRMFSDRKKVHPPPYQKETAGCTRTSPGAHCSCYFCEASSHPEPSPAPDGIRRLSRSMSTKVSNLTAPAPDGIRRLSRSMSVKVANLASPARIRSRNTSMFTAASRRGTL